MPNLFPKAERLKTHEIILLLVTYILLILPVSRVIRMKELSSNEADIITFVSFGLFMLMFSHFLPLFRVRFTRLFNTILWFIPCIALLWIYRWSIAYPELAADINETTRHSLLIPFFCLIYKHLMRIIHILLFKTEPLFVGRHGAVIIDKEQRLSAISSDKAFSWIELCGYLFILFYFIL